METSFYRCFYCRVDPFRRLQIFETSVESVEMLGCEAEVNMAAFCRKKAMERNRSSRPSGHSRAQMRVEFIREIAFFFGVNLQPPMLSGKAIFYVFKKIVD